MLHALCEKNYLWSYDETTVCIVLILEVIIIVIIISK